MHGSHTHQSVRNVKSTRGYVRADVIKGQRGMIGMDWFFCSHVTNVSWYWMLIRKLCKYLCAPANIAEDTVPVAISQRFHVWKYEKFTPWKIHWTNKAESRKCGSFAKPKFRDGSIKSIFRLSDLELQIRSTTHVTSSCHEVHECADLTTVTLYSFSLHSHGLGMSRKV